MPKTYSASDVTYADSFQFYNGLNELHEATITATPTKIKSISSLFGAGFGLAYQAAKEAILTIGLSVGLAGEKAFNIFKSLASTITLGATTGGYTIYTFMAGISLSAGTAGKNIYGLIETTINLGTSRAKEIVMNAIATITLAAVGSKRKFYDFVSASFSLASSYASLVVFGRVFELTITLGRTAGKAIEILAETTLNMAGSVLKTVMKILGAPFTLAGAVSRRIGRLVEATLSLGYESTTQISLLFDDIVMNMTPTSSRSLQIIKRATAVFIATVNKKFIRAPFIASLSLSSPHGKVINVLIDGVNIGVSILMVSVYKLWTAFAPRITIAKTQKQKPFIFFNKK